jgi:BRCT domain type II-containing protein
LGIAAVAVLVGGAFAAHSHVESRIAVARADNSVPPAIVEVTRVTPVASPPVQPAAAPDPARTAAPQRTSGRTTSRTSRTTTSDTSHATSSIGRELDGPDLVSQSRDLEGGTGNARRRR